MTAAVAALAVAAPASAAIVSTTTTVALSSNNVALNQPVTITATVTAALGVLSPTGNVTFQSVATDGTTTTIGTGSPLVGSGLGSSQASITTSSMPGGTYQIVAKYSGAFLTFSASTSDPVQLAVAGAVLHNTQTTLTADKTVITSGDSATFTANVSETDGVLVPTGTVTFTSIAGGVQSNLGQADLDSNGNAQLTVGGWQAGSYTIVAQYVGDKFDHGSSAQLVFGVNGITQQLTTTTTVALSPTSIQTGGTVDITATVAQSRAGAIPPAGDHVNFYATASGSSQAVFLGSADVTWTGDGSAPASGVAVLSAVAGWQPGQYTVTADFIGDIYDGASAGHAILGATSQGPTTLPYIGDTTKAADSPANVSFQLLDGNSQPVAAEQVTIMINGQSYTGTSDSNGNVAIQLSLPVGTYPVTAEFTGDDSYLASAGNGTLTITQLPTSLTYTGDSSITAGSPATIGFVLKDQNGNVVPNESVSVTIDGQTQALTSDANGNVSFVVTKPGGTYPISASFGGDATYLASNGSGTLAVNKIPTTTTYSGDTAAGAGKPATLSATLVDVNGQPLSGKSVTLGFGSTTCSATTNASGVASCTATVNDAPGTYTVTASFAGDGTYLLSSGPGSVTVTGKSTTTIVDNVTGNFLQGSSLTLSGTLTANGLPVAGKQLLLTFGLTPCTGTTNASGVATCTITVPGPTGPTLTTASFLGDAAYKAALDTKPALVYANAPGGGSFVVGDQSDTGSVYFWGSQWWKQNSLSHGDPQAADPAAFKGFAANPGSPQCNVNWSTDPGNSTPPPSGPLPAYMTVIVTDHNAKSGSTLSGDTVSIVIVKTDAGYKGDPGHDGTGTVVATLCTGTAYSGSGSATVDCSAKGAKCESLLANPSVAAGGKVTAGQTLKILYTDDDDISGTPTVALNGQSLAVTVTKTSGQTPTYVDSYGGSKSTKYQSWIAFQVPAGLADGSYTFTVTAHDGDGDVDVYNWTVTIGSSGSGTGTGTGGTGGGSTGSAVTCTSTDKTSKVKGAASKGDSSNNGVKCESLLANPSVASGAKVTSGQTISILYADDSKLCGDPTVTIDGQSVATSVATTSGVKPVYVDTYGGSASTKYESLISFKIPSGLASGSHTITVTVQDGDGDYDVYSFTVKL